MKSSQENSEAAARLVSTENADDDNDEEAVFLCLANSKGNGRY